LLYILYEIRNISFKYAIAFRFHFVLPSKIDMWKWQSLSY